jgi:hypothetical protein
MKIRDIILEMTQAAIAQVEVLKSNIAGKIRELPDDEASAKALREIEDLLQSVGAGGRKGMLDKKLQEINDPAVMKYRRHLARYLLSIASDYEPAQRDELFTLWKEDKIVNIDKMLSKQQHSFADIFNGYSTNPMIKEFIDDVMADAALGQGKGEFGLNVLSKRITKPGEHSVNDPGEGEKLKGDLLINGRKIEVKTTDGGSARFTDQEVAPAEGYEASARSLLAFVYQYKTQYATGLKSFQKGISTTGLNGKQAIEFGQAIKGAKEADQYFALVQDTITKIFGGEKADAKMINQIMTAFKSGNTGAFLQFYSQASLNYYLGQKDDEGVLAINLKSKNFVFYKDAKDLANVSQRLEAETFYLTNTKDKRMPYPQLEVVPTTFGANAAEKEKKQRFSTKVAAQAELPAAQDPVELDQALQDVVQELADLRGVKDPRKIRAMFDASAEWLASQKNKTEIKPGSLEAYLEKRFPELKYKAPEPAAPAAPDDLDVMKNLAGIAKPKPPTQPTVPGQTQ